MSKTATPSEVILDLQKVSKSFPRPDSGGSYKVLEDLTLQIRRGEFVALLGRSGSGKSTLLRIAAGLIQPSAGIAQSSGLPVRGANPDVAMVFQSFALLPWLTVQDNVEIGLENMDVSDEERVKRALDAIRLVGLDGFEKAYPKELSGGMQQRVGFARAFVMRPRVLMLDEPFSALDVLTAENLRGEISDLWESDEFPADSVLMVTHNIEEAVLLADRVVILGANPGHVRGEIRVQLERPRDRKAKPFRAMCDHIYTLMTNPETKVTQFRGEGAQPTYEFAALPEARAGAISGFLELVQEYGGPEDVAVISQQLRLHSDELLTILDAAVLLGFANVSQGDVTVTEIGSKFAMGEIEESKQIFRDQVLKYAPLVALIHRELQEARNNEMKSDYFLELLDQYHSEEEAEKQFYTAVDWGRYAGLFEYEADSKTLNLYEND
ncbi:MAG: nitrate/sulfonate/bicarbonate ABC transporter ATP-binding protein [Armatimonadetes bacterium]|nr:nitrate/sulfonate/bicarbonate ABC transporter ATP-binding protein [Armatimonadota bacterium]